MISGPTYYTEQELEDLYKERAACARRMKEIGAAARELATSQQQLITKIGVLTEQQKEIARQPHHKDNAVVRSAFKLQLEVDATLDEWYAVTARKEELQSDYECSRSILDANLSDILRDPRMRELCDELRKRQTKPSKRHPHKLARF